MARADAPHQDPLSYVATSARHAAYEERPAGDLSGWVSCWWRLRAGPEAVGHPVLPDGCADIVWSAHGGLRLVGPARRSHRARCGASDVVLGIRLRPGALPALLGVPALEVVDVQPALADVLPARPLGRRAREAVAGQGEGGPGAGRAQAALLAVLRDRADRAEEIDPVAAAVVALVHRRGGPVRSTTLSAATGMSERQLRRRASAALGYGPRTYGRIVRMQALLARAERAGPGVQWASIAVESGYADQAHMINDVTALAGASPARLLAHRHGEAAAPVAG